MGSLTADPFSLANNVWDNDAEEGREGGGVKEGGREVDRKEVCDRKSGNGEQKRTVRKIKRETDRETKWKRARESERERERETK